jgi:tRNA uridine 5-carboxymethylaminomethyl modification enzyme
VVGQPLEREYSLYDLLRRPSVTFAGLRPWMADDAPQAGSDVAEQVEIGAKYAGYIERQRDEVDRQLAQESVAIPAAIDYAAVRGLSREVQQKLAQHRPETVGQAARIQGVTPAAISLLLVHLKRRSLGAQAQEKQA